MRFRIHFIETRNEKEAEMNATTNNLCDGFMVHENDADGKNYDEVYFARMSDGTVYTARQQGYGACFGCDSKGKARNWAKTESVPATAEFIGRYPAPKFAAVAA